VDVPALDRERAWHFEPRVIEGDTVAPGDVLGVVAETAALEHRILVVPGGGGRVTAVVPGPARLDEPVLWIDDRPVTMLQRWAVREPRPFSARLDTTTPLVTGQRAIDVLFPIARGGTATIPGGFGTGKTVLEQSLAKWSHADVVVYVGCGERGNELTEVLEEFPALVDPRTGASLMERTILIANTSNMPVAAREASIYTGITLAEYFRDQGYQVALMADSTSRWGEALREVSGRLEEMPAEEGYPAYLSTRLAEFYERAGAVRCLRAWARELLGQETQLLEIVQLLGADSLAPPQRVVLRTGRLLREDFLQQSAFDERDAYCALAKQLAMLRTIRRAHRALEAALARGADVDDAGRAGVLSGLARMRDWPPEDADTLAAELADRVDQVLGEIV